MGYTSLPGDLWFILADEFLSQGDVASLSLTCSQIRSQILPILFGKIIFDGTCHQYDIAMVEYMAYLVRMRRRVQFLSTNPRILRLIRHVELYNWHSVQPRFDSLFLLGFKNVRVMPRCSHADRPRMCRELASLFSSTLLDIIDFINLTSIQSLLFVTRRYPDTITPSSYGLSLKFETSGRSLDLRSFWERWNTGFESSFYLYDGPLWDGFEEALDTVSFPLVSMHASPNLLKRLLSSTKYIERLNTVDEFWIVTSGGNWDGRLEDVFDASREVLVRLPNLTTFHFDFPSGAINASGFESFIKGTPTPIPKLQAYSGSGYLLPSLLSENSRQLERIAFLDNKWSDISAFLSPLGPNLAFVHTLDLSYVHISGSEIEEIATIFPRLTCVSVNKFICRNSPSIGVYEYVPFPFLIETFRPLLRLEVIRVRFIFPHEPTSMEGKFTQPMHALRTIDMEGNSIFSWIDQKGWTRNLYPQSSRPLYEDEDLIEAKAIIQKCILPGHGGKRWDALLFAPGSADSLPLDTSSSDISLPRSTSRWISMPKTFQGRRWTSCSIM
ncbi:hypothetical protein M422DRAFT_66701 [Sphaerobolus stellatus SS14]|uniref:Uncharacterized protein n=1 Tax=Sphaerobolus stellatus (strain SS14) TaxID=990650 RepID=A0A0C9VUI2_SPHS4|nr:hypothetical protein M422DRAFT_66701 [Sphaerobolus stellatus SS14]